MQTAPIRSFEYKNAFLYVVTRIVIALMLVGCCFGCVVYPKGTVDLAEVEGIQALAGCYRNVSEGGRWPRYLSSILWSGPLQLVHNQVDFIRVVPVGPNSLRVSAETTDRVLIDSVFVEGKDFRLQSGKIEVNDDLSISLAYPAGNPLIGVVNESEALGMDKSGNAVLETRTTRVGTAFIIFPIATQSRDSFRFPKAPELCGESKPRH